jgi:hypothetical protein
MRNQTQSRRAILPPQVYQRPNAIQQFLPHLTRPQQLGLALWCFGIQLARSHSLTLVSLFLAPLCQCHAIRKRLKTTKPLECTVLTLWERGMSKAWLVLTDLPPQEASAVWYRHQSWIEQGFRDLKRLGWSCHRTLVREAGRLERVWLALAVATVRVMWYGTDEDAAGRVWGKLWGRRRCVVSVFRLGWLLVLLEALGCVEDLRSGWFPDALEPVEEDGGSWA